MPGAFQWSCFSYHDPNAELMPTELSYLRSNQGGMKNNHSNGNGRHGNGAMEEEENSKYCAKSSDVEATKTNTAAAAAAATATATSSSSSSQSINKDIIPRYSIHSLPFIPNNLIEPHLILHSLPFIPNNLIEPHLILHFLPFIKKKSHITSLSPIHNQILTYPYRHQSFTITRTPLINPTATPTCIPLLIARVRQMPFL